MIVEQTVEATYGELEQVLMTLGFQASRGMNEFGLPYVIYENEDFDASIALPLRPEEEKLYGGHFIVAVKTVEGRGIASRERFYEMLHQEARKEAQAA